jgi:DNA-binding IclR family transcriptional regulator
MSSQPNQSLIEGLACMQFLATAGDPVGTRELARRLDLNPMRANRLLKTLADIGLAQQDAKKRYSIGPGVHALTAQTMYGSKILNKALPLIKKIQFKKLTIAIGVLWREKVTYLYHGQVGMNIEEGIGRIGLVSFEQSSIGMLLASELDDESVKKLFKSIQINTTQKKFISEIKKIRKQKYAVVESHGAHSHLSLALPIGKPVVAAIALSGIPTNKSLKPYMQELTQLVDELKY